MKNPVQNSVLCMSNIVPKEISRNVYQWTLNELANAVLPSAGPLGSTTEILKSKILKSGQEFLLPAQYTKDGRTIANAIMFGNAIEDSIQKQMVDACDTVDDKVGDGTTSILLIAAQVFNKLCELDDNIPPYMVNRCLKKIVEKCKEVIKSHSHPLTLGDVHDIAMISTNSNEEMSNIITNIYKDFGKGAFIEVLESADEMHHIIDYRGLTLNTGFAERCYINEMKAKSNKRTDVSINNAQNVEEIEGLSVIDHARVYAFVDPIDTPEMTSYLEAILEPFTEYAEAALAGSGKGMDVAAEKIKPTVIITPKISLDVESRFETISRLMNAIKLEQRMPLLVVTNIDMMEIDTYSDIFTLCGCKPIKKYIDPKLQQADLDAGKAFLPKDAVENCYGYCECVKADANKTVFINPKDMFVTYTEEEVANEGENPKHKVGEIKTDENGEFIKSGEYNMLISYIDGELKKAIAANSTFDEIAKLRRRLNSLKGCLVQLYVGGATIVDRDSVKDLVVDAVKNIRSASSEGVGYGTNFEGLRALTSFKEYYSDQNTEVKDLERKIYNVLLDSYTYAAKTIYNTMYIEKEKDTTIDNLIKLSLEKGMPFNIATEQWDGLVKCSIEQDIAIMDTIAKIIGIIYTTNQAVLSTISHNVYVRPERVIKEVQPSNVSVEVN